ncbi:MAG TPA: GPW/gp25 family protein [Verrucomicrobiae bacterium]|jgi:predicted component of type VI protein secretion system
MPPVRSDNILPSLFDRLTGGTSPYVGAGLYVSREQYLKTVRRDLLWLLKTDISAASDTWLRNSQNGYGAVTGGPVASLADYPLASSSVLAFGVPLSRGAIHISSTDLELERTLERAIRAYEPRLRTLRVRVTRKVSDEDINGAEADICVLSVEIRGKVSLNAVSQDLVLQAYYTPAFAQWRIEGAG